MKTKSTLMNMHKLAQCLTLLFAAAVFLFLPQRAEAHPPTGIVVDQRGNVYFSDLETVWKLDTSDKVSIFRPGVRGRHVHELSIDKDGNIYGADISYEAGRLISDIWKMTPDGKPTYLLEPTSNPPRGMSLWLDDQGNMYFVEQNNQTKTQTLLLRRTKADQVTVLAGSAYGHLDGTGVEARFGSIGGMAIMPDGSIYLTDGTSVRKVKSDGVVTTIAKDLNTRTADDRPLLFGRNAGILSGLSVDGEGTVFLADAGNQRLLKINRDGKVDVVYRGDLPYYPNGVTTTPGGDLYALEVGFKPPSTWLPPRVRKITSVGRSSIVAVAGEESASAKESEPFAVAVSAQTIQSSGAAKYVVAFAAVLIVGVSFVLWKRKRGLRNV